jgi:nucleotide-binding universal stress UspA family protein
MKKILFPTDFSPVSKNAFDYAIKLAKDIDAKVDVINIYSLPISDNGSMLPEYIDSMLEEKEKHIEVELKEFIKGNHNGNLGKTTAQYGIFVYQDLIDKAREENYDLIVMGTKGERNLFEKIMGSVTTHTMMNAPCPVLAIPEKAKYNGIESIAYATDFVPKDEKAIDQLIKFSETLEAKVHFVHVETEPAIGDMRETIEIDRYPFENTDFALLNRKTVMDGLDSYIESKKVDILAMFIPRRKLWERLFHRSFTKQMTFHSHTPLLVFHE